MQGYALWSVLTFLLNAALFILIGLQLPVIVDGLSGRPAGEVIGYAAAVCARGDRGPLPLELHRSPSSSGRSIDGPRSARAAPSWRIRVVGELGGDAGRGLAGRGAGAAADTDAGAPLPGRELIQFITFALILVTVVGRGAHAAVADPPPRRGRGRHRGGERGAARPAGDRPRRARAGRRARGRGLDPRRHRRAGPRGCTSSASGASRSGRGRSRTRTGSRRARSPISG